jgi:hypothetical protein
MPMEPNPPAGITNRTTIISLVAALFTLLSFCTAVAPIPFTGWVCYPSAAVMGLVAFVTGLTSIRQIRSSGENGRIFGLIGAWVGGLTTAASLCAITLGILSIPILANIIHLISK